MKSKISMTLLPAIFGILAVLVALFVYNLVIIKGIEIRKNDIRFFTLFVPITIVCALIIQYFITLRVWERFKVQERLLGMNLIQFTILVTIIGGLIFGFVFWERSYEIDEFIWVTITGIIAFAIYWTINLLTLRRLDRA